jgi:hypothetical protein
MTPEVKKIVNKLHDTKLSTQKVELAAGDEESKKIETIWKAGQNVRSQALKEAISKVDAYTKEMVDLRVKMFKDSQTFSAKYKELVGESADNTQQIKDWNNAIRIADARINELGDFKKQLSGIL